ncbi:MAG: hypothetical protein QOC99_4003 [Acidobacteriota bacterium]|jgi:uncharacterized RDD family membrane protein YckC|nr:hypothetical protein [Acidobacteriota bacterium]
MQCAACNEEYPEALDECPQCRFSEPAQAASPEAAIAKELNAPHRTQQQADALAMTDNSNVTTGTTQGANSSTLIEFPGVNRNRPAWRKELSERFREIQQRRARDADPEDVEAQRRTAEPSFSISSDMRAKASAKSSESAAKSSGSAAKSSESAAKQLGLVPSPDEPELNPLVAAALRRIERAHRQSPPITRQGSGRAQAATAAARVVEEQPEHLPEHALATQPAMPERNEMPGAAHAKRTSRRAERTETEAERPSALVVVQPKQPAKAEQQQQATKAEHTTLKAEPAAHSAAVVESKTAASKPSAESKTSAQSVSASEAATINALKKSESSHVAEPATQPVAKPSTVNAEEESEERRPRHLSGVLDEFWLERQGIELLPKVATVEIATYDDRAPRAKRLAASFVDLIAVAFLSAPFAAAIELTISNWNDPRVSGSMALIVALVMFLYQTCSVALAGRTLGMSLCGLHAVDAGTASVPTTGQCMRRAFFYILSLATLGLGLLYSLFDAEGRTVHDILSRTVIVKK